MLSDEQLCKRLDAVEWCNFKLVDMYRGATQALESNNPDRYAQAANSFRELLEKLVYIATESEWSGDSEIKALREDMKDLLSKYEDKRSCTPISNNRARSKLVEKLVWIVCYIKQVVKRRKIIHKLLTKLKKYLSLKNKPTRERMLAKAMYGGRGSDTKDQEKKVRQANKLWGKLNKYVHHQVNLTSDTIEEFKSDTKKLRTVFYCILDNIQAVDQKEREIQKEIKEILGHDE